MFRKAIYNVLVSEVNNEFRLLTELLKAQSETHWPGFMGNEQLCQEVIRFFRDAFNSVVDSNNDSLNIFAYNHQIHQSLRKMRTLYLGPWPKNLDLGTAHPSDISATFVNCWNSRSQKYITVLASFMRPIPIPPSPPLPHPEPEPEPESYGYYVLKEIGIGAWNGLMGIPRMILNLEQTAKGLYLVATHPISSARAIAQEAYNRPYRMAANLLTGYLVSAYLIPKLLPSRGGPNGPGPGGPGGPGLGDNLGVLQNQQAAANIVLQESTLALENAVQFAQEAKKAAEIAESVRAAAVAANIADAAELSRLTAEAIQAAETFQRAAEAAEAARLAAEAARSASGLFGGNLPVASMFRNGGNSAAVASRAATERAAELGRIAQAAHQTLQEAQQALQVTKAAHAASAAQLLEVNRNIATTAQAVEGATRAVEIARAANIANIEGLLRTSHNAVQAHQATLAARAAAEANFAAASTAFSMANDRVVEATQANEIIEQLSQKEASVIFAMALEQALNEFNELEMGSISQSHFSIWNERNPNIAELSSDEESDLQGWVCRNSSSSSGSNYGL